MRSKSKLKEKSTEHLFPLLNFLPWLSHVSIALTCRCYACVGNRRDFSMASRCPRVGQINRHRHFPTWRTSARSSFLRAFASSMEFVDKFGPRGHGVRSNYHSPFSRLQTRNGNSLPTRLLTPVTQFLDGFRITSNPSSATIF